MATADVGVMAARGDEEQRHSSRAVSVGTHVSREHRADHGDVGKMRAAVIGRIVEVDVARGHGGTVAARHRLHRLPHGAEVHRHVGRVGDERAHAVEQRTGKVEALLDVDRLGGIGERHAHFLRDGHEQIIEHFQHNRIGQHHGIGRCRCVLHAG